MPSSYISVNGKAKQVTKAYIGVNGVAKEVNSIYCGISGLAKQVYANEFLIKVIPLTKAPYRYITHTKNNLLFSPTDDLIFGVDKKGVNFDYVYLSNKRRLNIEVGNFNGYAFYAGGYDSSWKYRKEIEFISDSLVRNDSLSLTGFLQPASAIVNNEYLAFLERLSGNEGYYEFSVFTKNLVKTYIRCSTKDYSIPLSGVSYGTGAYFNLKNNGVRLVELTENLQCFDTNVALSEYDRFASNSNIVAIFNVYGNIRSLNKDHVKQLLYTATYGNQRTVNSKVSSNKYAAFSYSFSSGNYLIFIDKLSMVKEVTNLDFRSAWLYALDLYKNYIVTSEDLINYSTGMACTLISQDYLSNNNKPLSGQ